MSDPRLLALSERINKYVGLIRAETPNMAEREILYQSSKLALSEQKTFEAKIRRAVASGELKVSKGGGRLLFKIKWIDRWLLR